MSMGKWYKRGTDERIVVEQMNGTKRKGNEVFYLHNVIGFGEHAADDSDQNENDTH